MWSAWGVLLPMALGISAVAAAQDASLRFEREGGPPRELSREELVAACGPRRVEVPADPYYGRAKRFWACPLDRVLALGFGEAPGADSQESFFLRARDGYLRPASGAQLAQPGGWLAFADADLTAEGGEPVWEPIDRRQLDPGPFYLVWTGAEQDDPHRMPWPYQLVALERVSFESRFPHTLPEGAPPGSDAWRGYAIFRRDCFSCHAVNGEGGTVGPELNVPRSIVEYRPAEQIKAYVRDPQSFRYTTMPAHPGLDDADLDALVAYFQAMAKRKRDPRRAAP